MAIIASVEPDDISGQKPAHQMRQTSRTRTKQKMSMIAHQYPGIAAGLGFWDQQFQPIQKVLIIRLAPEDSSTFDSPDDDMMEDPGGIESW
jgi:hypothetical protein